MSDSQLVTYTTSVTEKIQLNSKDDKDWDVNNSSKSNARFYYQSSNIPEQCIEKKVSVVSCRFPRSLYIITEHNDTIYVNSVPIQLQHGNYNANTFISAWATLVPSITVTFSSITEKFTFTSASGFTLSDAAATSVFPVLGFVKGNTYVSTANIITAPYCVNFSGTPDIYIYSSAFQLNNISSEDSSSKLLEVISLDASSQGHWYFENQTGSKFSFSAMVNDIKIELRDQNGASLNFNNQDWRITLEIQYFYQTVVKFSTFKQLYERELLKLNS
jgi:hypothetical protein